ncbi:Uncharacterised protein [Salmonella enterica subsp. enterica serovar Bovismorbificans]|uniref:Uncharacterized protein n=1 Tax=Salmonella enterica subsp. enterica serovar Bovismorbificans TaxID=58097 RepID=A0A655CBU7_SALET|nr:Uncharacterised protein [Salmonella enterica subsp. enterica serovar Bovismorbificans]
MTLALQRQNRKQIIYRIMDVSPLIRCFAIRYPPQTQQRHDMVNAQRAAVLHIGAQQVDKGLIRPGDNDMRVHWRQPPVLTERAEDIRRRADRCFQAVQLPVAPGFRAAFRYANRQIAVQTNR